MRWKSVALAGALGPVVVGCNIARDAARNVINEPLVVHTQQAVERDLRHEARVAWREVCAHYPRRAFTAEFRDGFTDGYVDYLDRGGNGSLPPVPPTKYTRHKKYFTENGQCLVKDYFLGFKYGQEIAIATGSRQFLTVPVLLPQQPVGPPAFAIQPSGAVAPHPIDPLHLPTPVPTPKPPPAPIPSPTPRAMSQRPARPASPETLPIPTPPLPIPGGATGRVPAETSLISVPVVKLPAPPPEIPELPYDIPTPPVTDELSVVPPIHAEPPVVPPIHPQGAGK